MRLSTFPADGATVSELFGALAPAGDALGAGLTPAAVDEPAAPDVAPLRERKPEIAGLAADFAARACEAIDRPGPPRLAPTVLTLLEAYPWPGDVRELRDVIGRAVVLCDGPCIELEHVPLERLRGPD